MDGEAIMTVFMAVVALSQLVRRMDVLERRTPRVVILLSALHVLLWVITLPNVARANAFGHFGGRDPVATSTASVHNFARRQQTRSLRS